jgi:hypothetical protein
MATPPFTVTATDRFLSRHRTWRDDLVTALAAGADDCHLQGVELDARPGAVRITCTAHPPATPEPLALTVEVTLDVLDDLDAPAPDVARRVGTRIARMVAACLRRELDDLAGPPPGTVPCERCGCPRTTAGCANCANLDALAPLSDASIQSAIRRGDRVRCRFDPDAGPVPLTGSICGWSGRAGDLVAHGPGDYRCPNGHGGTWLVFTATVERWLCGACAERRWPGMDPERLSVGKMRPTPCADCGAPTMDTIPNPAWRAARG